MAKPYVVFAPRDTVNGGRDSGLGLLDRACLIGQPLPGVSRPSVALSRRAGAGELTVCSSYRTSGKQAEFAARYGVDAPFAPDETYPPPELFPEPVRFRHIHATRDGESCT